MKLFSLKKVLTTGIAAVCLVASTISLAGVAVIVHPANNNILTQDDIANLFLGKKKSYPDGSEAIAIDQNDGTETRDAFTKDVLKKTNQQLKAFWAQQLFTGKGTPPKTVGRDADVKKLVAQNPSLIGYIDSSEVDASVKVIAEF